MNKTYAGDLLLVINGDTIKGQSDSIYCDVGSIVTINYSCTNPNLANPGVIFGWGNGVNPIEIENGFQFTPTQTSFNQSPVNFTIGLVSNNIVYDYKTILFIIREAQNVINFNISKKGISYTAKFHYNLLGQIRYQNANGLKVNKNIKYLELDEKRK